MITLKGYHIVSSTLTQSTITKISMKYNFAVVENCVRN